jgi:hypothetical protein
VREFNKSRRNQRQVSAAPFFHLTGNPVFDEDHPVACKHHFVIA